MSNDPASSSTTRATGFGKSRTAPRALAALAEPGRLVLLLVAIQFLLWGVLAARYDLAPPTDSLEQLLFSQDLRLFYVKHPALPTWVIWLASQVAGPSIALTFVLGALCVSATLLLLYAWARPLVGARRAALATLLTSTIVFMNAGALMYNNNTVQLPLALLSIVLFHRALASGRWRDWAWLGAGAALFMLAKYSAVVLFASFALFLLWTGRLRERAIWPGLGIATLVFAALVVPPAIAAHLADGDSSHYAWTMMFPPELSRVQRLVSVWNFIASQVAAVAPAVLLFFLVRRHAVRATVPVTRVPVGPFVTLVGFGPLVLTLVAATLLGARLLSGWGTTFYVLLPLWLVAASSLAIDVSRRLLVRVFVACIAVHVVLWVALIENGGSLPSLYRKGTRAAPPPPPELADVVRRQWTAVSDQPLTFIVADIRTGAPLAVALRGAPRVIDGNRPDFALEFPAEVRAACGFVAVTSRPPVVDPRLPGYDPLDASLNEAAPLVQVMLRTADGTPRPYYVGVRRPSNNAACVLHTGNAPGE